MKALPILLALGVLGFLGIYRTSVRVDPSSSQSSNETSFEAFVDRVGLDAAAMSPGLRQERILSGGKISIPLCLISPKREAGSLEESPLEAFARSVAADPFQVGSE